MSAIDDTLTSLQRVQNFDAASLERRDDLGVAFHFADAIEPAKRLISIFLKIPVDVVKELPENERNQIRNQADSVFNIFDQVMKFDPKQADAQTKHESILVSIVNQYQSSFTHLHPFISYSMARTVDFNQLSDQGRAIVQRVNDEAERMMDDLNKVKDEAEQVLASVRDAAAEQGVTQLASYFAKEADLHRTQAENWRRWTMIMAAAVAGYGVVSMFLHKLPLLAPASVPEAIQLTASKILIFFVLVYVLILCARNFLSNRHNEIVNRHRQNSLMTYTTMVKAGGTPEARDVVLTHAAASIYQLHDTGYIKAGGNEGPSSSAVVEMIPRSLISSGGSAS